MFLARKLGRTVAELRQSMTPREFLWQFTYDQRRANEMKRARDEAQMKR